MWACTPAREQFQTAHIISKYDTKFSLPFFLYSLVFFYFSMPQQRSEFFVGISVLLQIAPWTYMYFDFYCCLGLLCRVVDVLTLRIAGIVTRAAIGCIKKITFCGLKWMYR